MNFAPCQKIFSDACLDGGFTGWPLSLVSKSIYEVLKPTRFQSLAIHNYKQVIAFAHILEWTPLHLRCVYTFSYLLNPQNQKNQAARDTS
jgi:hypothetical protein